MSRHDDDLSNLTSHQLLELVVLELRALRRFLGAAFAFTFVFLVLFGGVIGSFVR